MRTAARGRGAAREEGLCSVDEGEVGGDRGVGVADLEVDALVHQSLQPRYMGEQKALGVN